MHVEITITHENGMRTSHQYTVPNDNNVQLVCTNVNSNGRTAYPLVQVQSRPIMGQSSQINPHFRRPGAAPGAVICSEYMAKRLRDQTAGLVPEPNILVSHNSPHFSFPSLTPSRYDPSILLNSCDISNGNAQVVKGSMSTESAGGRVAAPERQNPKHGPYTCKRCGEVFDICQALAAHMMNHYRLEETTEERLARQASKYKRKRANNDLRLELTSSSIIVPGAAPDLRREKGENSKANGGHDDHVRLEHASSTVIVPEPLRGVMDTAAPDVCKESDENPSENKDHDLE